MYLTGDPSAVPDSYADRHRSRVTMGVRHAEAAHRLTLEIEFDQHDGLAADDPAVMARFDRDDLRSLVLDDAAVGVFDVNLAASEESDVSVHAQIGADHRFHVDGPAESRWIHHPLDACRAGARNVEP